jgi:hypothetical protein
MATLIFQFKAIRDHSLKVLATVDLTRSSALATPKRGI